LLAIFAALVNAATLKVLASRSSAPAPPE